jgi:uncharacterized linocin/CFP29 family protein
MEEGLSSALLQFRRRATQLGQLEDWFIFNGTYPSIELPSNASDAFGQEKAGHPHYRPAVPYLDNLTPKEWAPISGTPRPIAGVDQIRQKEGMRQRNPGALGLIEGPRVERVEENEKLTTKVEEAVKEAVEALDEVRRKAEGADRKAEEALRKAEEVDQKAEEAQRKATIWTLDNDGLMKAIVDAINSLEENGYVAPYVCVFGRKPFQAAYKPINNSTVLPRDRIEPLIGRELLHASGIDIHPQKFKRYDAKLGAGKWESRGVLLSMADEPIDLALAAEATPEFRQVDVDGKYVFSVFERFALRIKDAKAIVPLKFVSP